MRPSPILSIASLDLTTATGVCMLPDAAAASITAGAAATGLGRAGPEGAAGIRALAAGWAIGVSPAMPSTCMEESDVDLPNGPELPDAGVPSRAGTCGAKHQVSQLELCHTHGMSICVSGSSCSLLCHLHQPEPDLEKD